MPALREVIEKACPGLLVVLVALSTAVSAQTSVDDVHIEAKRNDLGVASRMGAGPLDPTGGMGSPLIRTSVRLVLVPVSVTDLNERFVTGLNKDNFQIFEGKTPQKIQTFSSEDVPISIGIILDISGSMADKVDRLREAVNQFCEAANPHDEFFLIEFSDEPRLAVDFTDSSAEIEKDVVFTQAKGKTSLLDAIHMGLQKMKYAKYGKKALLVISDGGDNHSRIGEKEVKGLVKESGVMIYSIGVFDRYVQTQEELLGPTLLSEVTEPTGGRAYALDNLSEMPTVARHIGVELRTQYVLAYRPEAPAQDTKWRKIRVKLMLPKKLSIVRARAKPGYYPSVE
jgi:Ca-activated chloride channel family protein